MTTDLELYIKFQKFADENPKGSWALAVFEGSPEGGEYSWCNDCVAAKGDLRQFLSEYKGHVKVVQFKVGTKEEWEGRDGEPSPFKGGFPHLVDLPSAVLFHGRMDVARMIAPRREDLEFLARRAEIYEKQVKSGSWHPPLVK